MKNVKYYLLILCTWTLSCTEKDETFPEPEIEPGFAALTVELPTISEPGTYAIGQADENTIKEIDVLVFKRVQGDDIFSYRLKLSENDIQDASGSTYGERKTFDVELRNDQLIFVIIANARASVDRIADELKDNVRKEDILAKLVFSQSGKWPATSAGFTPFPMWGETRQPVRLTDTSIGPVSLMRAVVRIDIGIDVFGDPALGFGQKFKLKEIYVYNVMNKGAVTPDMGDPGITGDEPIVTYPYIPLDATPLLDPLKYEYTQGSDAIQKFFGEIYTTESDADNVCLVVGGFYDNSDTKTFYKIAFADNGSYLQLLRNHRYLVNIKGVRRKGFATFEEAHAAEASNVISEITVGENTELTEYVFNGQYMLGVETGKKTVNYDGQLFRIQVYTTCPTGWKATVDPAAASWLEIEGSETGGPNQNNTLAVGTYRNTDVFVREGKITIEAGSLRKDIFIKQRLGANCYIVKPYGSQIRIPVAFANADGNMRVTDGMSMRAEILWMDEPNVLQGTPTIEDPGKNALLTVTANREGNAVVGVINQSDNTLIWCWHIWVTGYEPDKITGQRKNNNAVFMDCNLGARSNNSTDTDSYGLLYQWGRKDPFTAAAAFNTEDGSFNSRTVYDGSGTPVDFTYQQVTNDLTLEQALLMPLTFLFNDRHPYNWHTNGSNSLWSYNGEKTPYDPSPEGWKIPESGSGTNSPWYGYSVGNGSWNSLGGMLFDGNTYYPATGVRRYLNGAFYDVAQRGYAWSATGYGSQALCLGFGPTSVTIDMTAYRGNALPVRCVKEDD